MRKLQTYNIRNMPEADSTKAARSWITLDDMYEALATKFAKTITKNVQTRRRLSIKTIGLGALTYADVKMGLNHLPSDPMRDYLRLRVYHIDARPNPQAPETLLPTLTQVVKGADNYDLDDRTNMRVFERYWLG